MTAHDQLEEIFSYVRSLDADLKALFERLHGIGYAEAGQCELEEARSGMAAIFDELVAKAMAVSTDVAAAGRALGETGSGQTHREALPAKSDDVHLREDQFCTASDRRNSAQDRRQSDRRIRYPVRRRSR